MQLPPWLGDIIMQSSKQNISKNIIELEIYNTFELFKEEKQIKIADFLKSFDVSTFEQKKYRKIKFSYESLVKLVLFQHLKGIKFHTKLTKYLKRNPSDKFKLGFNETPDRTQIGYFVNHILDKETKEVIDFVASKIEEISEKFPETKVIMLTSYAEDEMLFSAIRAGASGYVLKQIEGEGLLRAIEAVGRGEALLDPAVTQRIFQEVRKAAKEEEASAFAALTQQEKHVLMLVSEGKTNREIAKALFLGEGTVRNYVSSILSKLGVSNRAEAAAYAVEHNLRDHL